MAESLDNVSEKIESVRLIVSILIKMGLEINLNEDNTLNLEVNSNTIDNFIKGYSNTLVLDGEFTLGNLTAFSLQGF